MNFTEQKENILSELRDLHEKESKLKEELEKLFIEKQLLFNKYDNITKQELKEILK